MKEEPKHWKDVYHYVFGYTVCPYCGDETGWYNPTSNRLKANIEEQKANIERVKVSFKLYQFVCERLFI